MFEPPQPPAPTESTGGRAGRDSRGLAAAAIAVVLVVVVAAALINSHRTRGSAARQRSDGVSQPSLPSQGRPSPNGSSPNGSSPNGNGNGPPEDLQAVACPQIRDDQSHLGYRCIDNYLRQDGSDTYLGLRIALDHEVEPGWVISEGSGNPRSLATPPSTTVVGFRRQVQAAGSPVPSTEQVSAEVRRRTELALARAYGDNPTSRTLAAHPRSFGGVQGFELLTEITMNPAYRAARKLNARTERLWTVGLPTQAGVSIFMLSIPDDRADLWPRAEATVGTIHVI